MKLKKIADIIILNRSLAFHIHASILKLICSIKLNTKKRIENLRIFHDSINFSQKRTKAITSANTKNKILKAIDIAIKFFNITSFIFFILLKSFVECNSEKTGNKNPSIGHKSIKGIVMMDK